MQSTAPALPMPPDQSPVATAVPVHAAVPAARVPALPAWLWRAVALLIGMAAVGYALRTLPMLDAGLLDRWVIGRGLVGLLCFVGLAGFGCAVGVPRQVAAFAAGYAFAPAGGIWAAIGLGLAPQMLGCAADFGWARLLARDWVAPRLPARLARLEALVARRPFAATLTLRLLPVGNNLALNLLAGASSVSAPAFFAASLVGYLPQTAVCALLGAGTQVGRGIEIALAAGLFVVSAGIGGWLLRGAGVERQQGESAALDPSRDACL